MNKNDIELLAPAGDIERLKVAIKFGANAVFLGGTSFGMRAKAKNFDMEQMAEAVQFAHSKGVKVYVTANIFAHEEDFDGMAEYFIELEKIGVDALIVADLGVFNVAAEAVPNMELHISTQANNTNAQSALAWAKLGASRVVLARELSFEEIKSIHAKVEGKVEIEAFVHGSMCISYSGRCLLSAYFTNRHSNKGECSHVCRYKFALQEERRPGQYFPVHQEEQDGGGTYILNSKDMCMIQHIPELVEAGIKSFKIEGRMKTPYYVAAITSAYREAIDDYFADPALYESKKPYYLAEVMKSSHREFTTGFYLGDAGRDGQIYMGAGYVRTHEFLAIVKSYDANTQIATVEQRGKFSIGETLEFLCADRPNFTQVINEMTDEEGNPVASAPHAQQIIKIKVDKPVSELDILRGEAKS